MATVKLENGKRVQCRANMIVTCLDHNVSIPYGKLSPIAKLAFHEGIDTQGKKCLLQEK